VRLEQATVEELLRLLLSVPGVSTSESVRLQGALESPDPGHQAALAFELIETLIERGLLRERAARAGSRRIEDLWNHRSFLIPSSVKVPYRRIDPGTLPPPGPSSFRYRGRGFPASWIRGEIEDIGALLDPREMLAQFERGIPKVLALASGVFHPRELPLDWAPVLVEERPPGIWEDHFDVPGPDAGEIYVAKDLSGIPSRSGRSREGSLLVMGIAERDPDWSASVELHSPRPGAFGPERQGIALFLIQLLERRLTASFRLQAMVFRDVLTQVYNRSYFEDQVEREIRLAERQKAALGLCIIDIDDFRDFNTEFGYAGGDAVLKEVADRLRTSLRSTDTLARYGGDEFAVLLAPALSPEEAQSIAERLRDAVGGIRVPMETLDKTPAQAKVNVSIGLSLFPQDGKTMKDLWNAANRGLLRAKAEGKNRWSIAEREPARKGRKSPEPQENG